MRSLLTHPWLSTLPTYLETPGMDVGYDKVNLDRARAADRWRDSGRAPARGVRSARIEDEKRSAAALNRPLTQRWRPGRTKGLYRATVAHQIMPLSPLQAAERSRESRHSATGEVSIQ